MQIQQAHWETMISAKGEQNFARARRFIYSGLRFISRATWRWPVNGLLTLMAAKTAKLSTLIIEFLAWHLHRWLTMRHKFAIIKSIRSIILSRKRARIILFATQRQRSQTIFNTFIVVFVPYLFRFGHWTTADETKQNFVLSFVRVWRFFRRIFYFL